jgi:nicotinamidase-related amidase
MLTQFNTLLLQIDIQEKLVPAMEDPEFLLSNQTRLIQGAKVLNVPIIVTEQYPKGLGKTIPELVELLGESYMPIEKSTFSCCKNQNFTEMLENYGKHNILISGIETHICVQQTALDLKRLGYNPIIIEDCACSRKDGDHYMAIQRFMQEGVTISTYESVLMEICERSDRPEFKEISKIIK